MKPLSFSDAANYEIKIRGHLGPRLASRFEGFSVAEGICDDGSPVTNLSGSVADQSALHGLLSIFRDLGIQLISVRRVRGTGDADQDNSASDEFL